MFMIKSKCSKCEKEIKSNEEVFVKLRYPKVRGMAEIKAYLHNEGTFICLDCISK
ncbi:Fe3+ hydroxamate ABC transporter substrate-binding protein [Alkalihalobacillus sp. TS-13]|uniref:Fe3+ hydroxamate ABC transporter substrate-binding protein n=1 Tax=Alkalihalobacillus sp. TS-13 TaxID=2842455 RepID=UPI00289379ED|nr:Fe3+ hydroxamate ABC transporter substrate-binding protein [Alkalihalobacillus sp. TS-13]